MLVIHVIMKLLQVKEVLYVVLVETWIHYQQVEVLLDNINIITINNLDVAYQWEHVVLNKYQLET